MACQKQNIELRLPQGMVEIRQANRPTNEDAKWGDDQNLPAFNGLGLLEAHFKIFLEAGVALFKLSKRKRFEVS